MTNAIDWATKNIIFDEATALVGKFDIQKYRMLARPLLELDNIRTKRMVLYKASSAGGTVFMQIAMCYWLDQRPGNIQCVMQSGDAAGEWMKTRGKKWINRIPTLRDTMSNDKYAQTNSLYLWPHQFLLLCGPGENAQQSKQVNRVIFDEAHVKDFEEGTIASFEERMAKRWNRMSLIVTTAADEGKECDRYYYQGGQNEFHLCCPKCHNLVWPLWEEDSKNEYNGEKVFHFDMETMDVLFCCPFCQARYEDSSRDRYALHEGADYVCKNPTHLVENESFRFNCFGAWWMNWSGHLVKYREALEAVKLGNLEPHENWIKKRLTKSYRAEIPDLGEGTGANDYKIGSVWITEQEKFRDCAIDVQEAPRHYWMQCDEWLRNGDSRRVDYQKLSTWQQVREFQLHHGVLSSDTYCDAGHEMHEVFGKCEEYGWYAMFADGDDDFEHEISNPLGKHLPKLRVRHPYSMTQEEDAYSGKHVKRIQRYRNIPAGYCLSRHWSKYTMGGYLMAAKAGQSRYYGIASDINSEYTAQLNSYAYVKQQNKKSGVWEVILKQVRTEDHSFGTSSTCMLGAVIRGFFPLAETKIEKAA